MKTRKLLTFTLSLAMLFIAFGASAQHAPYGDMTDQTTWGYDDSVTVNSTLPYYVEPDATINNMTGNYDPEMNSSATTQGIYTDFSWSYSGTAGNTIQYYPNASNDTVPYVHVNFTSVTPSGSPDELSVTETAPGGGCSGTPVTLQIHVVDEPSFDVTSDGNNITYERCALTNENIQVNNIADNGIEGGNLKLQMDYTVENLDSDLSVSGTVTATTTEYPTIPEDGNLGAGPVTVLTRSMPVENSSITRYTYTFRGISDHISRKSDYWDEGFNTAAPTNADFTYYDPNGGTETSIAYIIYPTPSTGDIHFVPNSFDL